MKYTNRSKSVNSLTRPPENYFLRRVVPITSKVYSPACSPNYIRNMGNMPVTLLAAAVGGTTTPCEVVPQGRASCPCI